MPGIANNITPGDLVENKDKKKKFTRSQLSRSTMRQFNVIIKMSYGKDKTDGFKRVCCWVI